MIIRCPYGSHCTRFARYKSDDAPLPTEVLTLLQIVQEIAGFATISGSAPLSEFLYQMGLCEGCQTTIALDQLNRDPWTANDIDIFVPQYPARVANVYGHRGKATTDMLYGGFPKYRNDVLYPTFAELLDTQILPRLNVNFSSYVLTPFERRSGTNRPLQYRGAFAETIQLIRELELQTKNNRTLKVQFIATSYEPEDPNVPWSTVIPQTFDIDIIKTTVTPASQHAPTSNHYLPPTIDFIDLTAWYSLQHASMVATFRPLEDFHIFLKRIKKYRKRGFDLAAIEFDPRITGPQRVEFWTRFKLHYAYHFIAHDMLGSSLISVTNSLHDSVIVDKPGNHPELEDKVHIVRDQMSKYLYHRRPHHH